MREIKFRAWDKEKKDWINHDNWLDDTRVGASVEDPGTPSILRIRHKSWVIQQCTDIKDKNGKEIYEGDIVKLVNNWGEYDDYIGEVRFDHGGFWVKDCDWEIDYWVYSEPSTDDDSTYSVVSIEVLGNVYETPELLEEL